MELNAKNCLGPGQQESISMEFTLQCAWFDDNVFEVDDADFGYTPIGYEGPVIVYGNGTDGTEAEWVQRRIDQLEDLMQLKRPVCMSHCAGGWKCDPTSDPMGIITGETNDS